MDLTEIFEADIHTKQVTNDCTLNPTEITKEQASWLWATNNKYDDDEVDQEKVGKWMLFIPKSYVNAVWKKIKENVQQGHLWTCKVSTSNENTSHAIMIYTKDYTDKDDVISVLNHLESSGLKRPEQVIKYKTDQQTRAGIYSGGPRKAWIYASDTIRQTSSVQKNTYLSWRNKTEN